MDEAREYQEVIATKLADGNFLLSFVGPGATLSAAKLAAAAWGKPTGWCLNLLVALGLDAVCEKGLQRDPMPWITRRTTDLEAEIDAKG